MEPIDYLRALRRRWRVILASVLIAAFVALITAPPSTGQQASPASSYTATATLLQDPASEIPLSHVSLYVTSGEVPEIVAEELGFTGPPVALASQVTVAADDDVGSLKITSSGADAQQSEATANAFGEAIIAFLGEQQRERANQQIEVVTRDLESAKRSIRRLDERLLDNPDSAVLQAERDAESARYGALYSQLQALYSGNGTAPQMEFLDRAVALPVGSDGFVTPTSRQSRVQLGAALGLLLGCLLALVLERLDTRLSTRNEAQTAFRLPILAEIPRLPRSLRRNHAIVSRTQPGSAAAEGYRSLRSSLLLLPSAPIDGTGRADFGTRAGETDLRTPRVILVASARQGEGKTATTANVAAALAEAGKRVLVLDCDLRNPEAHVYLDVPNGAGMTELLASSERQDLLRLSRPTSVPGVRLITAGRGIDHATPMPTRMAQIVAAAKEVADIVLVDTTPILVANDAIDLMPVADTVLLVARVGRTTQEQAERAVELLARMRVPVSGLALIGTGQPRVGIRFPGVRANSGSGGTHARHRNRRVREPSTSEQGVE